MDAAEVAELRDAEQAHQLGLRVVSIVNVKPVDFTGFHAGILKGHDTGLEGKAELAATGLFREFSRADAADGRPAGVRVAVQRPRLLGQCQFDRARRDRRANAGRSGRP